MSDPSPAATNESRPTKNRLRSFVIDSVWLSGFCFGGMMLMEDDPDPTRLAVVSVLFGLLCACAIPSAVRRIVPHVTRPTTDDRRPTVSLRLSRV